MIYGRKSAQSSGWHWYNSPFQFDSAWGHWHNWIDALRVCHLLKYPHIIPKHFRKASERLYSYPAHQKS